MLDKNNIFFKTGKFSFFFKERMHKQENISANYSGVEGLACLNPNLDFPGILHQCVVVVPPKRCLLPILKNADKFFRIKWCAHGGANKNTVVQVSLVICER